MKRFGQEDGILVARMEVGKTILGEETKNRKRNKCKRRKISNSGNGLGVRRLDSLGRK